MIKIKKILFIFMSLLFLTITLSANYLKCFNEYTKSSPDKSKVREVCLNVAKKYEKLGDYDNASWFYLISDENDYNIDMGEIQINILKKDSQYIYTHVGHSYILKGEFEKAKKLYKLATKRIYLFHEKMEDDYYTLFKLYPSKVSNLKKGEEIYKNLYGDEIYKPLDLLNEYYQGYIKARKASKKYKFRAKDAISALEIILKIQIKCIGQDTLVVAQTYDKLAQTYGIMKKDYQKALEYHLKALKMYEKLLSKNNTFIMKSYLRIGSLYATLGEYLKAMEYFKQMIKITISANFF